MTEANDTETQSGTPPRNTRSRRWCFTYNNYTEDILDNLVKKFDDTPGTKYVIGREVGKEEGTPHLQGCVWWKNAHTFNSMKKLMDENHVETTINWFASVIYCKKDNNYVTNIVEKKSDEQIMIETLLEQEYKDVVWKDWQQEVIHIVSGPVDKRAIYWFWEKTGNVGKSYLCKYLCMIFDAIVCEGKAADVFNQIQMVKKKENIKLVICDISRSNEDYVSYNAIEKCKNGFCYSGKYKGGRCLFPIPHVIVFSNFPPDMTKMSMDRWRIHNIGETIEC